MRTALAVLMALAFAVVGLAMLRSLGARPPHAAPADPVTPPENVRIVFWCENCGTELLLVRQGTEAAPRHCGESMVRREEVPHGGG